LDVSPTGTICFGCSCKTSWASANNYWSLAGGTGNVGISTTNTVGIGTTSGVGAGLVVMNGNVGIGTWAPAKPLSVTGDEYNNGNIGIGTTFVGGAGEAAFTVMNGNIGIGTWTPSSTLNINGSLAISTVVVSTAGTYNATSSNGVILVKGSGTAVYNICLPLSSSVPGREYIIKRIDASANTVSITISGGDTIDGQGTISIAAQYQSYTVISDGNGHW